MLENSARHDQVEATGLENLAGILDCQALDRPKPLLVKSDLVPELDRATDCGPCVRVQAVEQCLIDPSLLRVVAYGGEAVNGHNALGTVGDEAERDTVVIARA